MTLTWLTHYVNDSVSVFQSHLGDGGMNLSVTRVWAVMPKGHNSISYCQHFISLFKHVIMKYMAVSAHCDVSTYMQRDSYCSWMAMISNMSPHSLQHLASPTQELICVQVSSAWRTCRGFLSMMNVIRRKTIILLVSFASTLQNENTYITTTGCTVLWLDAA